MGKGLGGLTGKNIRKKGRRNATLDSNCRKGSFVIISWDNINLSSIILSLMIPGNNREHIKLEAQLF